MYKKFVNALYVLNIVFQSFYTLALPIGIGALASFLLVRYASVPEWIWAVLITAGALCGLYSMVKFILSATANLDRLEKQREQALQEQKQKQNKINELTGRNDEQEKSTH